MRTLSATLTAAQQATSGTPFPYLKITNAEVISEQFVPATITSYGADDGAQTFTARAAFTLKKVKILLAKATATPGNFNVRLYNVVAGLPTSVIETVIVDGNTLPLSPSFAWTEINFADVALAANTQYAISINNGLDIRWSGSPNTVNDAYPYGARKYYSGGIWNAADGDLAFKVYGDLVSPDIIRSIDDSELMYSGMAEIVLDNSDLSLSGQNLAGEEVQLGWGFYTSTPAFEYSLGRKLWIDNWMDVSRQGRLEMSFACSTAWDKLATGKVGTGATRIDGVVTGSFISTESVKEQTNPGGVDTGVTALCLAAGDGHLLVVGVAGGTLSAGAFRMLGLTSGAVITNVTVTSQGFGKEPGWDGNATCQAILTMLAVPYSVLAVDNTDPDNILGTYQPYYSTELGTDLRTVFIDILNKTKHAVRLRSDGLHLLYIDPAPVSYDYTYDATHTFWNNSRSRGLIKPNQIIAVDQINEAGGYAYSGVAVSAASVAKWGYITQIITPQDPREFTSDAVALLYAGAYLNRLLDNIDQGGILAPMNCGQEILDYVQIDDTRSGVTISGRVHYINRRYSAGGYSIELGLGGVDMLRVTKPDWALRDLVGLPIDVTPVPIHKTAGRAKAKQLDQAMQPYELDFVLTAIDDDDLNWAAGNIKFADGRVQIINAGSVNLATTALTYLYLIVGNSVVQATTTFSTAVGADRVILAYCKKAPVANQTAMYLTASGKLNVNGDDISVNSVTAAKIFVATLEAITANMGLLTAGEIRLGDAGTPDADYNGLRFYKSGSTYRMEGQAAGVKQAYFDSDGKLLAGAGSVVLDASGVKLVGGTGPLSGHLKIFDGATEIGNIFAGSSGPTMGLLAGKQFNIVYPAFSGWCGEVTTDAAVGTATVTFAQNMATLPLIWLTPRHVTSTIIAVVTGITGVAGAYTGFTLRTYEVYGISASESSHTHTNPETSTPTGSDISGMVRAPEGLVDHEGDATKKLIEDTGAAAATVSVSGLDHTHTQGSTSTGTAHTHTTAIVAVSIPVYWLATPT